MPFIDRLDVFASIDGRDMALDSAKAMTEWFSEPRPGVCYRIETGNATHRIGTVPIDPAHLVRLTLSSMPGVDPGPDRRQRHWTLLDDFTKAHCAALATALAPLVGGRIHVVCRLDPEEFWNDVTEDGDGCQSVESMHEDVMTTLAELESGFVHAGVRMADGTVLCPMGRNDAELWAHAFARCEVEFMHADVDERLLTSFATEPTPAIRAVVPHVARLISFLA